MPIPKIIHQLAPADKSKWHPGWTICSESWKNVYPSNFQHIIWSDENADDIVQRYYPQFFEAYKSFPFQINRIDFVRWCILHKFGGIYADMDMYCYKDFYSELIEECYIVGSGMDKEIVQNSLMISAPKQPFWYECMEKCVKLYYENSIEVDRNDIRNKKSCDYILELTSPRFLTKLFNSTKNNICTLPTKLYNNNYLYYGEELRTRHMLTGMWGKEMIDLLDISYEFENKVNKKNYSKRDFFIENYFEFRKIDMSKFDFKKNYLL